MIKLKLIERRDLHLVIVASVLVILSVGLVSYLASTVPLVYALQTRIVATGVPAVSPS